MIRKYRFKHKDDKVIELTFGIESMCPFCYSAAVPKQARIVFDNNLVVDFNCSNCKNSFLVLPTRERARIIELQ